MISEQLQKKIDSSIKLLQMVAKGYDEPIGVAYSGGKDSDVILQLAKEAGIKYRAIYKNTTIDPPGTIQHVREMGVEILQPKESFFKLIEKGGFPTRFRRFCCSILKEYKVLDKVIIGVRKSESTKRSKRYNEPTECRYFGNKKEENHVEQIYPILNWTDEDVKEFINDRGIKVAPIYYDENGEFHVERRLGCMGCPLKSNKKRLEDFKEHPQIVKAYCRAGQKFLNTHTHTRTAERYSNVYEWFFRHVFCESKEDFGLTKNTLFGATDYKEEIEKYFNIKF